MIKYKIDILKELKSAGFTTYRLRKEKLLSEGTVQKIRENSTGLTLEVVDLHAPALSYKVDIRYFE